MDECIPQDGLGLVLLHGLLGRLFLRVVLDLLFLRGQLDSLRQWLAGDDIW